MRGPAAGSSLRGVTALASTVAYASLSARRRLIEPRRRRLAEPRRRRAAGAGVARHALRGRQRTASLLTEADAQQLAQGLTVLRQVQLGPVGTGLVVMDVDAPPSLVIERLSAFEEYAGIIPVVRQSDVTSRGSRPDGTVHARADYRISKFWLGVSVVHKVDYADGTVSFELDASVGRAVLHEAAGTWRVEPVADKPASCRVWLEVGLRASSLLPHWIIDYAARRALRRATSWLKPYMEDLWHERQLQLWGMRRDVVAADEARCRVRDNAISTAQCFP